MPWAVDTLKINGEGVVMKSFLYSFELDMGYYFNFLVVEEESSEIIKVVVFPEKLYEKTFLGEGSEVYSMHFFKVREGRPVWIEDEDVLLIAKEYKKKTGKKLQYIKEI